MFAYAPWHVLLSHSPVLRATRSVLRVICLNNSSVPSLRYHELFIPPQAYDGGYRNTRVSPSEVAVYGRRAGNAVQRRSCCLLSFWRTVPAVVQRTLCTDDVVLCRRSGVQFRLSCSDVVLCRRSGVQFRLSRSERCVQTMLCSAVVQAYSSGCRAANVVYRRCCALPSFRRTVPTVVQRTLCTDDVVLCRRSGVQFRLSCSERCVQTMLCSAVVQATATVVAPVFLRITGVVSLVAFWQLYFLIWGEHRHVYFYLYTFPSSDTRAPMLGYTTLLCPLYFTVICCTRCTRCTRCLTLVSSLFLSSLFLR